ncbi:MAG: BufA2 family periplasmic bufferin-type metallophore [Candidatus Binatia bacterium]
MNKHVTGALIATAVAALFVAAGAEAQAYRDGLAAKVHCEGANACKGQSSCKSERNACSGKNDCKGKGWIAISAADCVAKGGTVK